MGATLEQLSASASTVDRDIRAAKAFTDSILAVSVEDFTDDHFDRLEQLIETAIGRLSTHPSEEAPFLVFTLTEALRGIRQGLHPDPRRRPTPQQLAQYFEADLRGRSQG